MSTKIIPIRSRKPDTISDLVRKHDGEQVLIWTQYDEEGEIIRRLIPQAVNLSGKTSQKNRLEILEKFRTGELQILISKPELLGTGLNLQYCHVCIFSWSKDSFEEFYQAFSRLQRYGQKHLVTIYIPYTDLEWPMLQNVLNKQSRYLQDSAYQEKLYIESLADELKEFAETGIEVTEQELIQLPNVVGENYQLIHGDSIEKMAQMPEDKFDLAVFSPPFADLYSYTDKKNDLGNCNSQDDEFHLHFSFFVHQLYRVMKPGCIVAMHIAPLAILKSVKGYAGIRDFPGECISIFNDQGFIYQGRATIGKNPQAQAIRTKAHGLLFKTLKKDSRQSRFAIPDYLLKFQKPGEALPIANRDVTNEEWIKMAHPIWDWVDEHKTLNAHTKGGGDTKHICPLQLDVIDASIRLWSNIGDLVLSPFMGIGSEGVMCMRLNRKFVGVELKAEYFETATDNIRYEAEQKVSQGLLFQEVS